MPFTLWKSSHWAMVPASAIICFLLLGIEEIGVQIEEPFGILPLGKSIPSPHYFSLLSQRLLLCISVLVQSQACSKLTISDSLDHSALWSHLVSGTKCACTHLTYRNVAMGEPCSH